MPVDEVAEFGPVDLDARYRRQFDRRVYNVLTLNATADRLTLDTAEAQLPADVLAGLALVYGALLYRRPRGFVMKGVRPGLTFTVLPPDFPAKGRLQRVIVQAEAGARMTPEEKAWQTETPRY